ncbi:MAG: hypothetical protein UT37_C0006G0034 [Parcubacteria group bacterium GW2011_GWA2_39_18]|nr:MAG: hypothetical protein UT37_C0006G0034 [Parcubacteria group bacterium GW2011_GWA2_39_18]
MPNSEYYSIKSNSMLNLMIIFLITASLVAAGIFFLPQLVELYFSYDSSLVVVTSSLVLPKSDSNIVSYDSRLNNLQLPQGIPLNITENIFGRVNPFAPL